jgi:tetratricopeptide (TPR) repeat protein
MINHRCGGRRLKVIPVFLGVFLASAAVQAGAAQKSAIENEEVAKPILEAQKLAAKKQWNAALAALMKAREVPDKSPYAEYKIDEFLAYIYTQQRKYAEAAEVFERMIASGQAPQNKQDDHVKTVAQLYFNAEQYPKAIQYAQRGLKSHPGNVELLELAGQAQFLIKDYRAAAASMSRLADATAEAGRKPEESWLLILLNSHHALNNEAGVDDALKRLLRFYPKQDHWARLFARQDVRDLPQSLRLGYYRLMFEVGVLKSASDIEEMALSAVDAGAPAEAVRVLEWAFSSNIIPESSQPRFQRMLSFAKDKVRESSEALAQMSQDAKQTTGGHLDAALGRAYLGAGEYRKAIAAFQQAIKEGGLEEPDRTRTNLAIAHLELDQLEQARRAVEQIDTSSQWRDLGDLWILQHQHKDKNT